MMTSALRCAPVLMALVLAGCPEEVRTPPDTTPPVSIATLIYPAGGEVELTDNTPFLVSAVEINLRIEIGELGTIRYTLDGSDPVQGNPNVGGSVDIERVTIRLSETTQVRWTATDAQGNVEEQKEVNIVFDRDPPVLTVDPPPGEYVGVVEVAVSADEDDVTLHWTTDNSTPVVDAANTDSGPLPTRIPVVAPTTLRLLAIDAAGNRTEAGPLLYAVDTDAPSTTADPPGGRFMAPVQVSLSSDDPEATIYFTIDGTEPTTDSTVYREPFIVERDLTLRFRSADVGGNLEIARSVVFRIGPRGPRPAMATTDPEHFPLGGGLQMAAAIIDVAGALAGRPGAVSTGADWATWGIGRTAVDAATLMAGWGPHAMNSTGAIDISAAGEGLPDENGNGSNLDETWYGRVVQLAERVGDIVPEGLHPPSIPLRTISGALARPPGAARTADGRPFWDDDYNLVRSDEVPAGERVFDVDTLAGVLRGLAARARSATATDHPVGEGAYARQAADVVGLRCVSCHGAGVPPRVTGPAELAGLLDPPSGLLDLLNGRARHFMDPATAEQVDRVESWITDGAGFAAEAPRAPGASPREGLIGLLAIDSAGFILAHVGEALMFDVANNRLTPVALNRDQYVVGLAEIVENQATSGTRQLQQAILQDRTFFTGPQARLLRALADWMVLGRDRADLFQGPLASSDAHDNAAVRAGALADRVAADLTSRVNGVEGSIISSWHPDSGPSDVVDTLALADAAIGLRAYSAATGDASSRAAADAAVGFMRANLLHTDGDYITQWAAGAQVAGARHLAVQWTALQALLEGAAGGDAGSRAAAIALWDRLEGTWYDPQALVWQTTLGLEDYVYDPMLVARTLDALAAASAAGLPQAEVRLADALDRVVLPFVWAETWVTGENAPGVDVDADGLPQLESAGPPDGALPVFRREMSL